MKSEKVDKYIEMIGRLKTLVVESEIDALMNEMDVIWHSMSSEEISEVDSRLRKEDL